MHYRFDNKDELLAAMGESLVLQVGAGLREAFGQVRSAPARSGVAGLRRLAQIGLRRIWPVIESTPGRQLLGYELTTVTLRNRAAGDERAGHIAGGQYFDDGRRSGRVPAAVRADHRGALDAAGHRR